MENVIKKISPVRKLSGTIRVNPDKSITHRALMLSSIAGGVSLIRNPSHALDCASTRECLTSLGVNIAQKKNALAVYGKGRSGLKAPRQTLNAGNSGSTVRMLSGILAGQDVTVEIDGDASLKRRPMKRIIDPLTAMGAEITGVSASNGNIVCPITIKGKHCLKSIDWHMNIASAQVKTAILFAGINAEGTTRVFEPLPSRDHTERMLELFGCPVAGDARSGISIKGQNDLHAAEITVPGDFSSAAFFIVLGLLLPHSEIIIKDVGLNKTRTGIIPVLQRMGAEIRLSEHRVDRGEPVGDIEVRYHELNATVVEASEIPGMIDEIPILSVAAAYAHGETVIRGAGELKYKESDRLNAISEGLSRMGADIQVLDDGLAIQGRSTLHGGQVNPHGDHRIAMALAIAGLAASSETKVNHADCVDISFPGFWDIIAEHVQ